MELTDKQKRLWGARTMQLACAASQRNKEPSTGSVLDDCFIPLEQRLVKRCYCLPLHVSCDNFRNKQSRQRCVNPSFTQRSQHGR